MKALLASTLAALALLTLPAQAVVNINTANATELEALPGIGAKKAQAIVEYRTKNGPFKSVEDLEKVNGIGKTMVEKLRKEASVSGGAKPVAKPAQAVKAAKP